MALQKDELEVAIHVLTSIRERPSRAVILTFVIIFTNS